MADKTVEELGDEITTLAAHINAATCRWLRLVAEFDRREGWSGPGLRSCAHWIAWRCSMSLSAAREHVRVAHRLEALPLMTAAFERGELSFSKIRALARIENVESEQELLDLALHMTASQLERTVRAYRGVAATERGHARALARRSVTCMHDDDGCFVLTCRVPAEEGAVVRAAMAAAKDELLRDRLREDGQDAAADEHLREQEISQVTAADAFMLMCDRALSGDRIRTNGDRYQAVVDLDEATLHGTDDATVGVTDEGTAIPSETVRRLCCDATLVAARGDRTGKRSRVIPSATRRAVMRRDKGCRFPGCTARRYIDLHHIKHWIHGGETTVENLLGLCRHHHVLHHEGRYTCQRRADGEIVFRRPDGRIIPSIPRPCEGRAHSVLSHAPAATPTTITPRWYGERLNLGLAVDALLQHAPVGAMPSLDP